MIKRITLEQILIHARGREVIDCSPEHIYFSDNSYITRENNELKLHYLNHEEVQYECKVYSNGSWDYRGLTTLESAKKEVERYRAEGKSALLIKHTSQVVNR
jgi:hypothetical protein